MTIGEHIATLRKEAGMTQVQLADKVFVTRQAVSRWETGVSEPSIDMRKLLAVTFNVPAAQLLDLPNEPVCQCCGTPFSVPNMPFGTDASGNEDTNYCAWCYKNGEFTYPDTDTLIETCVPFLVEATGMSLEDAVSFMGALVPSLQHWAVQNVQAK